jgi:hypothetical protein
MTFAASKATAASVEGLRQHVRAALPQHVREHDRDRDGADDPEQAGGVDVEVSAIALPAGAQAEAVRAGAFFLMREVGRSRGSRPDAGVSLSDALLAVFIADDSARGELGALGGAQRAAIVHASFFGVAIRSLRLATRARRMRRD